MRQRSLLSIGLWVLLFLGIFFLLHYLWQRPKAQPTAIEKGEIEQILRLSTVELQREAYAKVQLEGLEVFAIGRYKLLLSFDLDASTLIQAGDSLYYTLPPERIQIYELVPQGLQLIDSKGTSFLSFLGYKRRLTVADENKIRSRLQQQLYQEVYEDGSVQRARANAVQTLSKLLSLLPGTVIVTDPQPQGYRLGVTKVVSQP